MPDYQLPFDVSQRGPRVRAEDSDSQSLDMVDPGIIIAMCLILIILVTGTYFAFRKLRSMDNPGRLFEAFNFRVVNRTQPV